jgi:hypothetical protein
MVLAVRSMRVEERAPFRYMTPALPNIGNGLTEAGRPAW